MGKKTLTDPLQHFFSFFFSGVTRNPYISMGGTFQVTARFQDSGLSESNKNGFEMRFKCEFSPFRIQTLTWSHPCISF